jgi:hypothetical protein
MADDLAGIDDFIAQEALTRRARLRQLVDAANFSTPGVPPSARCVRRFAHPRRPTEFDALVDTCACVRASGHGHACLCGHGIERQVYRVDDDGREHYVTRPLGEE